MNAFTRPQPDDRDQLISNEILDALEEATRALELAVKCASDRHDILHDGPCMADIRSAAGRARPALEFARRANALPRAALLQAAE